MALKPLFSDIAGAIRAKNGSTVQTSANAFPDAVRALPKAFTGTPSKTYAGAAGLRELFSDTADAIRAMDGSTADIVAVNIPARIRAIQLLRSIAVTTPPKKTSYKPGDTFDPSGMVVTASYPNGVTKTVTGYSYSPTGPLSLGDTAITVSYTEDGKTVTATQAIAVQNVQVAVPALSGSLTYTGYEQTPAWTGYDSTKMTLGGTTSATNAGSYTAAFTPKLGYCWPDNTTGVKNVTWSIGKAAGSLSVSPTSVTLDKSNLTRTSAVTRAGDGAITAVSSDTSVATVSVSGKTVTIHSVNNTTGTATVTVKVAEGTNHTAPADVTISVTAQFNVIVGIVVNRADLSITRLSVANDPYHLVNTDITTEPVPAVGDGAGSSPFDDIYPWNKMREWNVVNNHITVCKGQAGFSRTANDVIVFVPGYYFRVIDDTSSNKRYYYISQKAATGFTKHPGSDRCMGKYETGAGYVSKSGLPPLVSITRSAARAGHKGRGSKFNNLDIATWNAYQLLYLVEYGHFDSQSKVGRGYVYGNRAAMNTGGCDAMVYHTGLAASTYGKAAVMYRGVEQPWGNTYKYVDGVNFSDRRCYICTNPVNFADDTTSGYTDTGVTLPSSGYISDFGFSSAFPWALIPSDNKGSLTSFAYDRLSSDLGWRGLLVSGYWKDSDKAGLFYFGAVGSPLNVLISVGTRMLYVPDADEIATMAA